MYAKFVKRLLDVVCSLIALPFWFLLFLSIAPAIIIEDKGPIFYNSPRLGKDGVVFLMCKFRSMRVNSPDIRNKDGSTFNAEDDPRLTKVGKFLRKTSIDETPQLFNVIKGNMSLIGPRPDLPEHRLLYEGNEERKLEIRPGITGFNQAYFRNHIQWKNRIQNDIHYIDNLSFRLDIKILINTIRLVLRREAIFSDQDTDEIQ